MNNNNLNQNVNQKNKEEYDNLIQNVKKDTSDYYDINNPVVKILLIILLITALIGSAYFIIIWLKK